MSATLHYFHGRGRAEQARWMLAATGVPFENKCLDTAHDFQKLKDDGLLLFEQVPLLEIDGLKLTQSQSIVRYLARRGNMYGSSPSDYVQCDMIADAINDFQSAIISYPFSSDRVAHLQNLLSAVKRYCPMFEKILGGNKEGGAVFLVGPSLTYPDVLMAQILTAHIEILPECLQSYPGLCKLRSHVLSLPGVSEYLTSSLYFPFPTGEVGDKYVHNVMTVLNR
eukprot:gene16855-20024_t